MYNNYTQMIVQARLPPFYFLIINILNFGSTGFLNTLRENILKLLTFFVLFKKCLFIKNKMCRRYYNEESVDFKAHITIAREVF